MHSLFLLFHSYWKCSVRNGDNSLGCVLFSMLKEDYLTSKLVARRLLLYFCVGHVVFHAREQVHAISRYMEKRG